MSLLNKIKTKFKRNIKKPHFKKIDVTKFNLKILKRADYLDVASVFFTNF
ncbi:membrane carboxypeptidase, penicillin-binding protein 1b [Streptococcus mutans]|nr:membrane carboxypeptidase, penicillin-binding protein 1b [Streptococcus mutans]